MHLPAGKLKPLSTHPLDRSGYRSRKITRSDYECGDESATDFAYAMALFRRGFTAQFVRESIMSERKQWNNHSGEKRLRDYMKRTIERARMMVDRC